MTIYKGKIKGDLFLSKGDDASAVTSIGGYLDVREGATCDLPLVTSIGGYLYVREGATCDLPLVTSIGGYLYVREGATCDLPLVTSIGGYLDVSEGATCDLPLVTSIGGSLYVRQGATCDLPLVTSIGGYPIPDPEQARARLRAIANRVVNDPAVLDMSNWHNDSNGCGTVHCIAGWAVHLEPGGYDLEKKVGSPLLAGNLLLGIDASKFFFAEKGKALAMLSRVLEGGEIAA